MALFEAELGPAFALGDAGVDVFFDDGGADAAGRLDAFAVVVEAVGYYCFCAVFVRRYGLRGEGGGVVEVVFDVFGPVGTAGRLSEKLFMIKSLEAWVMITWRFLTCLWWNVAVVVWCETYRIDKTSPWPIYASRIKGFFNNVAFLSTGQDHQEHCLSNRLRIAISMNSLCSWFLPTRSLCARARN